jgi:polysaccharide export outer membrane protein
MGLGQLNATTRSAAALTAMLAVALFASGCHLVNLEPTIPLHPGHQVVESGTADESFLTDPTTVPRELQKITLPDYVIEPPDVLTIDALKVIPKSPYRIEPLDVLQIAVEGTPPDQPINGLFAVDTGGMVQLGAMYGAVRLAGMTIEEATSAIDRHLRIVLSAPRVSVSLAQTAGQQQIVGEHMVAQDGTVNLGTYGAVYVTGLTIEQARDAVQEHLSKFLQNPKISINIFEFRSKAYYVITESTGAGDRVVRLPVTGNETVLDAMSLVGGTTQLSSKNIWIARPAPGDVHCDQILPVNWREITRGGSTRTNFQVLPGDRIFIAEDRLLGIDATIAKMTAPFERMFGLMLLGSQAIQVANRFPRGFQTGFGGF